MGTFQRKSKETDETFTLFFTVASPFSNFYPCQFSAILGNDKTHKFCCVEQYYMYHKAMAADNENAGEQILRETIPRNIKKIGADLENLDYQRWKMISPGIMRQALFMKYENNVELRRLLFLTRGSTLVEASPTDCTWGIGLGLDDPGASERSRWRGRNQLGMIMTAVREDLWHRDQYQKDREVVEKAMQEEGYFGAYFSNIARLPFDKAKDRKRFKDEHNISSQELPKSTEKRHRFSPRSERKEKRSRRERSSSRERKRSRKDKDDERSSRHKHARSSWEGDDTNGHSRKRKRSRERFSGSKKDSIGETSKTSNNDFSASAPSGSRHSRIKFDLDENPPQPAPLEKSITGQKRLLSLLQQEKKKMQQNMPILSQTSLFEDVSTPQFAPAPVPPVLHSNANYEIMRHLHFPSTISNQPSGPPQSVDIEEVEEQAAEIVDAAAYLDIPMPESPMPKVRRPQSHSPSPTLEEQHVKKDKKHSRSKDDDIERKGEKRNKRKSSKHQRSRRHRSSSASTTRSHDSFSSFDSRSSGSPHRSRTKNEKHKSKSRSKKHRR